MAYGSSDYAFEDAQNLRKLDDMVTEAKGILGLVKSYILADRPNALAKEAIVMMIEKFEHKKV